MRKLKLMLLPVLIWIILVLIANFSNSKISQVIQDKFGLFVPILSASKIETSSTSDPRLTLFQSHINEYLAPLNDENYKSGEEGSFRIKDVKFVKKYKSNVGYEPYIKGKIIPLSHGEIDPLYFDLPPEIRASRPEEVGTIVYCDYTLEEVGRYYEKKEGIIQLFPALDPNKKSHPAFKIICRLKLFVREIGFDGLSFHSGITFDGETFSGPNPPHEIPLKNFLLDKEIIEVGNISRPIPSVKDWEKRNNVGSKPSSEIVNFLTALPRKGMILRAFEPLSEALKDKDPSVRIEAAWGLGEIKDARAVKPLIIAFRNEEYSQVVQSLAWGLGKIGMPAVEPLLILLKDKEAKVRRDVVEALGEIKDASAVKPLIEALRKDENEAVRVWAAWALGRIRDARAVDPLISALKDKDWSVRSSAARSLAEIKDIRSVEPLIEALRKDNFGKIKYFPRSIELGMEFSPLQNVIRALGKFKDPRAIEPLIAFAKTKPKLNVNSMAEEALKEITGQDFGRDETKWQEWWEKNKGKYKSTRNGR